MANLQDLSTTELFGLYGELMNELQRRGICRSMNNPIADYAEWLASVALDAVIQPQSNTGFDLLGKDGTRYEVKARRPASSNPSRQLSAFRDLTSQHFDYLVGILFNEDLTIRKAALVPWRIVSAYSKYVKHVNGWIFHLDDKVWDLPGVENLYLVDSEAPRWPIVPNDYRPRAQQSLEEPKGILASEALERLLRYCDGHSDIFEAQIKPKYIPDLGKTVHCWRSTRLKLIREGLEKLRDPSELPVLHIRPKDSARGYEEGYFVITVGELKACSTFRQAMETPSFRDKGEYHWPSPPSAMASFFYPCRMLAETPIN